MARFDELFDEIVLRARSAADVAGKKTSEVMETSKLKYQVKQVSWDIEKAYAKLGAIVYEAKKSGENFDDLVDMAVEEIGRLNRRYDDLERKIMNVKNRYRQSTSVNIPVEDASPEPDMEPMDEGCDCCSGNAADSAIDFSEPEHGMSSDGAEDDSAASESELTWRTEEPAAEPQADEQKKDPIVQLLDDEE